MAHAGTDTCAGCHRDQYQRWRGSQHDLAMQVANEETVLGDFGEVEFTHFGVTSRFYRDGERFMVRTDGPDGTLHDYEVAYTFGVDPLQQYLIRFPDGRLQALGIAWDSRPGEHGGQRWFHLHPDEPVPYTDALHWTGSAQNWNHMCADCHSTGVHKNYDPAARTFDSSWFEIDVACEACHGPGSRHVAWTRGEEVSGEPAAKGFRVLLDERKGVSWRWDAERKKPVRSRPRSSDREVQTCARCHSRRTTLTEGPAGGPLLDTHRPALLTEPLYYPDGQIKDEVYVYGSFLQSRMYQAGVTCSDCHEPHSLELRAPGNGVCLQCHAPDRYDAAEHHFHEPESQGASCAECHMPARTYMVVDPRRDHGIRVPRPDVSLELGTPNACTSCHRDQSDEWAAAKVRDWYGRRTDASVGYAETIHSGRRVHPGAQDALIALLEDDAQPAIVRGTAATLLPAYASSAVVGALDAALHDPQALVRMAALEALGDVPLQLAHRLGAHLLRDPLLAIRADAGRLLAAVPRSRLDASTRESLHAAVEEYMSIQRRDADRSDANVNMGNLLVRLGEPDEAESAYRTAMEIDGTYVPAYVNLADLYRRLGREAEVEAVLRRGIERVGGDASLHHALGLTLVRQRKTPQALEELGLAADLAPDAVRYAYVYGVALHSIGKSARAIRVMEQALDRHSTDRDLLIGLATISRDAGDAERARRYASRFAELWPADPRAAALRQWK